MKPEIEQILPPHLRQLIQGIPASMHPLIEEIRIRLGRPLELLTADKVRYILPNGTVSTYWDAAYRPNESDCEQCLSLISNHSLYAMEEELKRGYATIQGGHRVGLVGKAVLEHGRVKRLRFISGFNIRIAREVKDVAHHIIPYLIDEAGSVYNTLIISPPQCGKTTLLRDIARCLSSGFAGKPKKVGVVDERSEIAGCVEGKPQLDLGPRCDILDACPKAEGMMMMIRAMSPEVLVVDEIGRSEDATAIDEAIHAGVQLITTAHGQNMQDISRRPILSRILQQSVFSRMIVLSKRRGSGTVEGVYDEAWQPVSKNRVYVV